MSISDVDGMIGALMSICALLVAWMYRQYKNNQKERIDRALQSAERDKKMETLSANFDSLKTELLSQMDTMFHNFNKNELHHKDLESRIERVEDEHEVLNENVGKIQGKIETLIEAAAELKLHLTVVKDVHTIVSETRKDLGMQSNQLIRHDMALKQLEKNCEKYHDN